MKKKQNSVWIVELIIDGKCFMTFSLSLSLSQCLSQMGVINGRTKKK